MRLGLFAKTLFDHERVHFFPRFELVELDFFQLGTRIIKQCHDGLLSADPINLDARIFVNLPLGAQGLVTLEEEPQFLVLVEGSRGAAHDLGLDRLGQRERQQKSDNNQKEGSHCKRVVFLFVFLLTRAVVVVVVSYESALVLELFCE